VSGSICDGEHVYPAIMGCVGVCTCTPPHTATTTMAASSTFSYITAKGFKLSLTNFEINCTIITRRHPKYGRLSGAAQEGSFLIRMKKIQFYSISCILEKNKLCANRTFSSKIGKVSNGFSMGRARLREPPVIIVLKIMIEKSQKRKLPVILIFNSRDC